MLLFGIRLCKWFDGIVLPVSLAPKYLKKTLCYHNYITAKLDKIMEKDAQKYPPKKIDSNLKCYEMSTEIDLQKIERRSPSTIIFIVGKIGLDGFRKFDTLRYSSAT